MPIGLTAADLPGPESAGLPVVIMVGFWPLRDKLRKQFRKKLQLVFIKEYINNHPSQALLDRQAELIRQAQLAVLDSTMEGCWRHCWALILLPPGCDRLVSPAFKDVIFEHLENAAKVLLVDEPKRKPMGKVPKAKRGLGTQDKGPARERKRKRKTKRKRDPHDAALTIPLCDMGWGW